MSDKNEELTLEEQVARIHARRQKRLNHDKARRYLNTGFLALAAIGLIWYYTTDENRLMALGVIGLGMLLKVIELFIRFVG